MHKLYCLIGESGSGKSYIAEKVSKASGAKILPSYTTRKKRRGDKDHTFVTREEFEKIPNKVVRLDFCKNSYCITMEQTEKYDIVLIDPDSYRDMRGLLTDIKVVGIYINTPLETRMKRMKERGDDDDVIKKRLEEESELFFWACFGMDYQVRGDKKNAWKIVQQILKTEEE